MSSEESAALFAQAVRFGNYEIPLDPATGERRELGRGGMGVTYLARDVRLGRLVVLKVVSGALQTDALSRKRFLREARALAYLKHPCIPVLYEFGESDGDDFYTMELVEGEDLAKRIRRAGPLSLREALWVTEQAATALAEAHAAGIVHRDVKPANLMISPGKEGDLPQVKLIDFGLAKDTGGAADFGTSSSGSAAFTPLFASPEQVKAEPATPSSDLYSLGVTLWFALTGRPPFHGSSKYEVEIKHVSVPPPLQSLPPSIPGPLRDLLGRALAKKPSDRPASAETMIGELRAIRLALPPTDGEQGISLGDAATVRGESRPTAPLTAPTVARKPNRGWVVAGIGILVVIALGLVVLALLPDGPAPASSPPRKVTPVHTSSLGQPFVRLGSGPVLFGAWKIRVRDFAAFAATRPPAPPGGMDTLRIERSEASGRNIARWRRDPAANWQNPGFPQTPEHPVVGVSWDEAREFCRWLTATERAANRIPAEARYRLPTDAEWTRAAGRRRFPWGDTWPPPPRSGNFCDASTVAGFPGRGWPQVPTPDGFPRTSPVDAHLPNAAGVHDLAGNAWEWCEDAYRAELNSAEVLQANPALREPNASDGMPYRIIRGGSWFTHDQMQLRSQYRDRMPHDYRSDCIGFRIVFDPGPGR